MERYRKNYEREDKYLTEMYYKDKGRYERSIGSESRSPVRRERYSEESRRRGNCREERREYSSSLRNSRERYLGNEDSGIIRGSSKNMVKMDIVIPRYLVPHLTGKNDEILKVIERKSKCNIRLNIDVSYYKHNRKMWI
jgi:hypothetical protein